MATTKKSKVVKINSSDSEPQFVVEQPKWFGIDWDKVKTVSDVKVILEHMGLGCFDNAPAYETLKKYLKND
jgi:hypothetical protein